MPNKIVFATPADTPKRAVIYTRFSPRPDASTSESCDVQRAYCEEHAIRKGYIIAQHFDDPDVSGADEYRPRLWAAIDALRKGDVLLVYKRDRLARNVYLSEMINRAVAKNGGRIEAVSGDVEGDGPEQQLVRTIVAAMAEYERRIIAKRTSDTMRRYMKQGRLVSSQVPFGYRRDPDDPKRMIEDEQEQKTLRMILDLYAESHSYHHVARSIPPELSRTGKWHSEVIRRIVARANR